MQHENNLTKYEYIKYTLIKWLCNILPMYFARFRWYRKLCYITLYFVPISLDKLHDELNDYSGELDMYVWYQVSHLISEKEYKKVYLGIDE